MGARSALAVAITVVVTVTLGACGSDPPGGAGAGGDGPVTSTDGAMPPESIHYAEVKDPCISTHRLQLSDMVNSNREAIGSGVAIVDWDGDGRYDVLLASQKTPMRACHRRPDGAFEDATAAAGLAGITDVRGFAVADYDNDGDQDLLIARDGPDRLMRNDRGVFADAGVDLGENQVDYSAAFCDLDGDGKLDLYLGFYQADRVFQSRPWPSRVYRNTGSGFTDVTDTSGLAVGPGWRPANTLAVTCTDFDGDGKMDIFEVNDFGMCNTPNRLLHNDGDLHFTDVAAKMGMKDAIYGMSAASCDFDNDGDLDLYATNVCAKVLERNDGDAFREVAREVGAAAIGYPVGGDACSDDYPGYGPRYVPYCGEKLDQFAMSYCSPETRQFIHSSFGAICFDADGDGWQDLAIANSTIVPGSGLPDGYCQPDTMLRNGGGTFQDVTVSSGLSAVSGDQLSLAAADLDGDGDLDLVMNGSNLYARQVSGGRLVMNRSASKRWLAVRLEGSRSNRDGIGARVEATAGEMRLLREVNGGTGFASAQPHVAHFGLGDSPMVDTLVIRWPSGKVDTIHDVTAGQVLLVKE